MTTRTGPLGVCLAAVALAAVSGEATGATTQECDALETTTAVKLEEFLEKELDFALSGKTVELVGEWRTEYDADGLLSDELAQAGDIERKRLAAEQAEIEYRRVSEELAETCTDGG